MHRVELVFGVHGGGGFVGEEVGVGRTVERVVELGPCPGKGDALLLAD